MAQMQPASPTISRDAAGSPAFAPLPEQTNAERGMSTKQLGWHQYERHVANVRKQCQLNGLVFDDTSLQWLLPDTQWEPILRWSAQVPKRDHMLILHTLREVPVQQEQRRVGGRPAFAVGVAPGLDEERVRPPSQMRSPTTGERCECAAITTWSMRSACPCATMRSTQASATTSTSLV